MQKGEEDDRFGAFFGINTALITVAELTAWRSGVSGTALVESLTGALVSLAIGSVMWTFWTVPRNRVLGAMVGIYFLASIPILGELVVDTELAPWLKNWPARFGSAALLTVFAAQAFKPLFRK